MIFRLLLQVLLCCALAFPSLGSDVDLWRGKPDSEVVALLGEPHKTKRGKDGGRTLTYKLLLMEHGAIAPLGTMVVGLPGVGLVGIPERRRAQGVEGSFAPGAPDVDEYGRLSTDSSSVSTHYDPKSGERPTTMTGSSETPEFIDKITVRFEVGADGRIAEWNVSGKKKRKEKSEQ